MQVQLDSVDVLGDVSVEQYLVNLNFAKLEIIESEKS